MSQMVCVKSITTGHSRKSSVGSFIHSLSTYKVEFQPVKVLSSSLASGLETLLCQLRGVSGPRAGWKAVDSPDWKRWVPELH